MPVWKFGRYIGSQSHNLLTSLVHLISDDVFASGSLDGTIFLWSLPRFDIMQQFNYVKEYDSHVYPKSVQHMICIDKVTIEIVLTALPQART